MSLAKWNIVCNTKNQGVLNIKCCMLWNLTAADKMIWWMQQDKKKLCVQWIHNIYMKERETIWTHNSPYGCSWYLK